MYDTIFNEATIAAREAQKRMVDHPLAFDCGFAWVTIGGKDPFVRWCKEQIKRVGERSREAMEYGDKGYPKGWQFWKPGRSSAQSIDIHLAGARAFAEVLNQYGIAASVGSRYD